MWASVVVMLVCAVITAVVKDNWNGASVISLVAMVFLIAAGGERGRVQRRNRD